MSLPNIGDICSLIQTLVLILWSNIKRFFNPQEKSVAEDIVLVTGGGRGIGRSLALQFARKNPKHIILWERNESALSDTAREVQKLGVNCSFMVCDVSRKEQVYAMAKEVEAKFGHVTVLVNNAGVVHPGNLLVTSSENIEETIKTNTMAHIWTTRAFLPSMLESNCGHIVTVSSMLGLAGLNGVIDYCTSKFAVTGFSEALRAELFDMGKTNVHVTTVHPYLVDNKMFAGAQTRFPQIFPAVSESYLAEKIVTSVLTNRAVVCVPRLMYLVAFFYCVAPMSAVLAVMNFLQINKTVDHLEGRSKH